MIVWVNRVRSNTRLYGVCLMTALSLCGASIGGLTHTISHLPAFQVMFLKCLSGVLILLMGYLWKYRFAWKSKDLKGQSVKAFCGVIGGVLWTIALQKLPLSDSYALSLLSAILTPLGAVIFFSERSSYWTWGAISLAVTGMVCILVPSNQIFSYYAWLPIGSAVAFSASSLMTKHLCIRDTSTTTLWHLMLLMSLGTMIPACYVWKSITSIDAIVIISLGTLYLISQIFMIEAYTYATAAFLAPLKFLKFPFAIIIGWFFFHESTPLSTFLGALLIIVSYLVLSCGRDSLPRNKRYSTT